MLVLSRRPGETITLRIPGRDGPIVLTLIDFGRSAAKIGIDADREIEIQRTELLDPPAAVPDCGALLRTCEGCRRRFSAHLVREMCLGDDRGTHYLRICPLCALERRNAAAGLPRDTPFQAPGAVALYRQARDYLRESGQ